MKDQACQATPAEMCDAAFKHYDELSIKAHCWHSAIPKAIRFWFLDKPRLLADLAAAQARIKALEGDAERYRWLRERPSVRLHEDGNCCRVIENDGVTVRAHGLDAAIDASIAKEAERG